MTEPGREMLQLVERILLDTLNIRNLADDYSQHDRGELLIAATHTQARYVLPDVVLKFRRLYPDVKLQLNQGTPQEIARMLLEGKADIGIATETLGNTEGLRTFQSHRWFHGIVVPAGHALLDTVVISLEDLAQYPVVTYHEGFTGRALIEKTFRNQGLEPNIVLSALDADVIKSYVELGLGVGIVASLAFNPAKDSGLRFIECSHLFHESISLVAVRQGYLLRRFARDFLSLCTNEDIEIGN
jgi:LysR family cys regulon transcriptional activator